MDCSQLHAHFPTCPNLSSPDGVGIGGLETSQGLASFPFAMHGVEPTNRKAYLFLQVGLHPSGSGNAEDFWQGWVAGEKY